LWRAIFLADTERSWTFVSQRIETFLQRVITDNTITYQDDKTNNSWTVGYYLGNAQFRIDQIILRLESDPTLREKISEYCIHGLDLSPRDHEYTLVEWQITHNILVRGFKIFHPSSPS
jgi:hypothetical protein